MRALRNLSRVAADGACLYHSVQHMLGDILESTRKAVSGDIVERAHDDVTLQSSH